MLKEKISVVIPAHNEEKNLPLLFERVNSTMNKIGVDYEMIVVDDGSTDNTKGVIADLAAKSGECLKGIIFSRNFGHQAALNAGLDYADGDAVVVMDADMQQPPELIEEMFKKYKDGADIIIGIRISNKQNSFIREKIGNLFYYLINRISDLQLEHNAADFGMYSRPVVDTLMQLPENDRFLRGLVQWVGFNKEKVGYAASERMYGVSKYNFKKLLKLALTGITSFSAAPLRFSFWAGIAMASFGFAYALIILFSVVFLNRSFPQGWASLILVVIFIGGLQLVFLGIIGEYVSRLFYEIKGRPLYIIKKQIGFSGYKVKSLYGVNSKMRDMQ